MKFLEDIIKHNKDIIDLIEEKDTLLIYDKELDETYFNIAKERIEKEV